MNTEKMRAVMLAADEGKPIQFRNRNRVCDWLNTSKPTWDWVTCDYRVKPEPKRIPRTMADLPEGGALWVRQADCSVPHACAVVYAGTNGVQVAADCRLMMPKNCCSVAYAEDIPHFEISADRKTWLPWWKEVEA